MSRTDRQKLKNSAEEYRIRVVDSPAAIDAAAWNRLLAVQAAPTPFMRHEYLLAMHESRSAVEDTGWDPRFVAIERGNELVAAAPAYLKTHSYGEYVFDWSWADAYRRHGLPYYPKLLVAVPFTPVPGSRLLAAGSAERALLAQALGAIAAEAQLSSAHVLFPDDADRAAFDAEDWSARSNVQFHWQRDAADPAPDFTAMLARMQREKRKKIQQERRRVAEAGVTFAVHEGTAIEPDLWDFFYACYRLTYRAHGSTPYLTRDFFRRMAETMPEHWLMFVAHQGGERLASSLIAIDRERGGAWGRYWGSLRYVPCLHFEACYYQPLQWCIEQGFARFEGGAQGEHKMARGLLPVQTHSLHWIRDRRFRAAVDDAVTHERAGVERYVDELRERSPFKSESETSTPAAD